MCINKKRNGMNIPVGKKKMKELAGDFVFLSKWRWSPEARILLANFLQQSQNAHLVY